MIREVIKPQYTSITIEIPTSYIDKELECIITPLDEKNTQRKNSKSLRGVFHKYTDSAKVSLENSAWQDHIINKFKQDD